MDHEIWEQDDEIDNYEVSNEGRVRNKKTGYILSVGRDEQGDKVVYLYKGGKKVRRKLKRLIAKHFVEGDISESYVKHKDGDKENVVSDNLILEERNSGKRIRVVETGEVYESLQACSDVIGVSKSYISKCVNYPFYGTRQKLHFEEID